MRIGVMGAGAVGSYSGPLQADALNGAVVSKGRELGIPTPVNETLLGCTQLLSAINCRPE